MYNFNFHICHFIHFFLDYNQARVIKVDDSSINQPFFPDSIFAAINYSEPSCSSLASQATALNDGCLFIWPDLILHLKFVPNPLNYEVLITCETVKYFPGMFLAPQLLHKACRGHIPPSWNHAPIISFSLLFKKWNICYQEYLIQSLGNI